MKFFSRRAGGELTRREFLYLAAAGLNVLLLPKLPSPTVPHILHGDFNSNKISLTFDDGWNDQDVLRILDLLVGKPASFFIPGACLLRNPGLFAASREKGIEFHNHTFHHLPLDENKNRAAIKAEIQDWEQAFLKVFEKKYTGDKFLRLPQNVGVSNPSIYRVALELGYLAILGWTIDSPGVYSGYCVSDVTSIILPQLKGGAIVLMHFVENDIGALPTILEAVDRQGLELVTLSKMPGIPHAPPASQPFYSCGPGGNRDFHNHSIYPD